MKQFKVLLFLFGALIFIACSKKETTTTNSEGDSFKGELNDVKALYNEDIVAALDSLGFTFNLGDNPPQLEGAYEVKPFILENSNIPTDSIGNIFYDQVITLSNQDNTNLTIDIQILGERQLTLGSGSFISGDGNKFSVYSLTETQTDSSVVVETTVSISGIITDDGISYLQYAGLMLDDKGDPDTLYIENNQGRLIIDSDFISPKTTSSSSSSKNSSITNAKSVFLEN